MICHTLRKSQGCLCVQKSIYVNNTSIVSHPETRFLKICTKSSHQKQISLLRAYQLQQPHYVDSEGEKEEKEEDGRKVTVLMYW